MKFNINDNVKVRLTPYGREMLKEDHKRVFAGTSYLYLPPKEDDDGFSTWQLWDLMSRFGEHISLGSNKLPFETEIEL